MTDRALIVATLLAGYIANPSNDHIEDERLKSCAYSHADALLAECGEGEPTQPSEIEWSLSASLLKQLVDVINHTNDRDMVDRITESVAFKAAAKYINGVTYD